MGLAFNTYFPSPIRRAPMPRSPLFVTFPGVFLFSSQEGPFSEELFEG